MKLHLSPSQAALVEIGLLFSPALPAYLWLWPNVSGSEWLIPVQSAVYVYFIAGRCSSACAAGTGSNLDSTGVESG